MGFQVEGLGSTGSEKFVGLWGVAGLIIILGLRGFIGFRDVVGLVGFAWVGTRRNPKP